MRDSVWLVGGGRVMMMMRKARRDDVRDFSCEQPLFQLLIAFLCFYVGILGICLSAFLSSSFYTPLQLLCKGRVDGLLFLDIPKDLKFI